MLEHDGRVGDTFRISLTYDEAAGGVGKALGKTETYRGRYLELVPDEKIVEVDEFETTETSSAGSSPWRSSRPGSRTPDQPGMSPRTVPYQSAGSVSWRCRVTSHR